MDGLAVLGAKGRAGAWGGDVVPYQSPAKYFECT